MDESISRLALHEAGHAVAHFVLGRPVVRVVARQEEHQTEPVPGTALAPRREAVLFYAGFEAELFSMGSPSQDSSDYLTAWMNGGHHDDESKVSMLAERYPEVHPEEARAEAAELIARYWPLIEDVARCLERKELLDQVRIIEIATLRGVEYGEAATT